jgi:hypothetical protein
LPTYLSLDFVSEDLEDRRVLPGGVLGVEPGSANPDTCRPEAKTDTSHTKVSTEMTMSLFYAKVYFVNLNETSDAKVQLAISGCFSREGVIGDENGSFHAKV